MLELDKDLDKKTNEKLRENSELLSKISRSLYKNVVANFNFDSLKKIINDGKKHVIYGKSPAYPERPYDIGYTNLFIQKSDEDFYECELLNEKQNIDFYFFIDMNMGRDENVKQIQEMLNEWCLAHKDDDKYLDILKKVNDSIPANDFKLKEIWDKQSEGER